jgi:hypothetical protein
MRHKPPPLTEIEFDAAFREGAKDEEIEATIRDLFFWSYIVRSPLGNVCTVGRGSRWDCIRSAFKFADEYATEEFAQLEDEHDENRALNGAWRLVLWPPRLDSDPPFWGASSGVFDDC